MYLIGFIIEYVCIIEELFLSDYGFPPLPLAVAFTLGTIFGCMINVFTIPFCRKRYFDIFFINENGESERESKCSKLK